MNQPIARSRRHQVLGAERTELALAVAERYVAGAPIRAIAAELDRSYGFVHRLLSESGVALRGRGGSHRSPRD
nr:helix-turn-helix domain-containing protein [Streptomyces sp. NBC_00830]